MAGEDLDAIRQLEQAPEAGVEVVRAVDGLDRQIRSRCVADEERIAGQHEPGLLGPSPVDDGETKVLRTVTRRVQQAERDVAEHDFPSVLEPVVVVLDLGRWVNRNRDPLLEREASVPGDVVGVRVGLEHADDSDALLVRRREVLLGRVSRIDDDGLVRLLVADEVRRAAEVVVDELPEDHDFRP